MKHDDFQIGQDFWCGGRRWRCTDIGTRVVVAICLERQSSLPPFAGEGGMEANFEPHEIPRMNVGQGRERVEGRHIGTADSSWFVGPPYAVSEEVFDEEGVVACTLAREWS